MVSMIGEGLLDIIEADSIKDEWAARHRFRLKLASFRDVCGFLNAEGGTLLIGVTDDGDVLGLGDDLQTLGRKPNLDGYELFLRQSLDNNLSIPTAGVVKVRFERTDALDVCAVAEVGRDTARPHRATSLRIAGHC